MRKKQNKISLRLNFKLKLVKMKIVLLLFVIGAVSAQRGSYAGSNRPISGTRYDQQNSAAPEQSNFAAPSQGVAAQHNTANRLSGGSPSVGQPSGAQQQPVYNNYNPGFGAFGGGFPNNQGFQPFPFAPVPYRQ
jgi:hypothetical protein